LTPDEEHEGAAGLLEAWAGPALSAEDALAVTEGRTMQRVLAVIARADERPEGMRIGFALKALREGYALSEAPARASPAFEHRAKPEVAVENGVVSGQVTAPPVRRDERPGAPSEEERTQMDALKAHLLSSMSPAERAWVATRRQARASFGKAVAEKPVDGLTPLKLIVQEIETEHEPRDHLRLAA
jgi:hypothetical protein